MPLPEATRLIVSLRDVAVRDEIISWTAGEALTGIFALLKELAPLALPPFDTQLLTTLAWAAYSDGDGALAAMALERVLDADPEHRLAQLLWTALEGGIEPTILRELSLQMAASRAHRRTRFSPGIRVDAEPTEQGEVDVAQAGAHGHPRRLGRIVGREREGRHVDAATASRDGARQPGRERPRGRRSGPAPP